MNHLLADSGSQALLMTHFAQVPASAVGYTVSLKEVHAFRERPAAEALIDCLEGHFWWADGDFRFRAVQVFDGTRHVRRYGLVRVGSPFDHLKPVDADPPTEASGDVFVHPALFPGAGGHAPARVTLRTWTRHGLPVYHQWQSGEVPA